MKIRKGLSCEIDLTNKSCCCMLESPCLKMKVTDHIIDFEAVIMLSCHANNGLGP